MQDSGEGTKERRQTVVYKECCVSEQGEDMITEKNCTKYFANLILYQKSHFTTMYIHNYSMQKKN